MQPKHQLLYQFFAGIFVETLISARKLLTVHLSLGINLTVGKSLFDVKSTSHLPGDGDNINLTDSFWVVGLRTSPKSRPGIIRSPRRHTLALAKSIVPSWKNFILNTVVVGKTTVPAGNVALLTNRNTPRFHSPVYSFSSARIYNLRGLPGNRCTSLRVLGGLSRGPTESVERA